MPRKQDEQQMNGAVSIGSVELCDGFTRYIFTKQKRMEPTMLILLLAASMMTAMLVATAVMLHANSAQTSETVSHF
jgi:hypothetical protein